MQSDPHGAGMERERIGLLGGTFDPIHVGHLALARAATVALRLDRVVLLPTGQPWQKPGLRTPGEDRLAMVRLAIAGDARLAVDDIELRRQGRTYTIDTLAALREALGPQRMLIWLMGSDQLRNLSSWHRWQELLDQAHLAVTQRERVPLSGLPAEVDALVAAHGADALPDAPAGSIVFFRMPTVPVSATAIRAQLARGGRPDALVPCAVLDYIDRHHLYGT